MTAVEFANIVTNYPAEVQNEFFDELKKALPPEDYLATVKFVSLFGWFKSPTKYKSMRTAICEELFGMEVPFSVKTIFDT